MILQLNPVPRECVSCGTGFIPYREWVITCSKRCYQRLPKVRAAESAHKAKPEVRARRNALRNARYKPGDSRESALRRNYGLTPAQWDAMYEAQGGVCAICAKPANPNGRGPAGRLHVDHDHVTGKVRALLCNNCNRGIGYLADNASLLRAAASYLESHSKEGK